MNETTPERQTWTARLRRDIVTFHVKTGMAYSTIGARALGNARFWERMQAGGTITLAKADQLYVWMAMQGHNFNQ